MSVAFSSSLAKAPPLFDASHKLQNLEKPKLTVDHILVNPSLCKWILVLVRVPVLRNECRSRRPEAVVSRLRSTVRSNSSVKEVIESTRSPYTRMFTPRTRFRFFATKQPDATRIRIRAMTPTTIPMKWF